MASVGDRWTLLVVEALLEGPLRFGQVADVVSGIAPNVLTARLRHLEHEGGRRLAAATATGRPAWSTS